MDFEKYTERSRGFVQAAQSLALRSNHQRFTPEHLLKVLLDDREGLAANLIAAAGGAPAKALEAAEAELTKLPKVEGDGAGQLYLAPETARLFEQAETLAEMLDAAGFVSPSVRYHELGKRRVVAVTATR